MLKDTQLRKSKAEARTQVLDPKAMVFTVVLPVCLEEKENTITQRKSSLRNRRFCFHIHP